MKRVGKTLIEWLIIFSIVAILFTVVTRGCGMVVSVVTNSPYSEGFREGKIYKFSHKGMFMKTWEGELAVEGYQRGENEKRGQEAGGNIWAFSVEDEEVINQINNLPPNDSVRLYYKEWYFQWPQGTNYEVIKVEKISD